MWILGAFPDLGFAYVIFGAELGPVADFLAIICNNFLPLQWLHELIRVIRQII